MSTATSIEALTRDEWHTLIDAGHLDDQKVELLDGRKVAMSPEGRMHVAAIVRLARQLRDQLDPDEFQVSEGHPIALSDISEPEPDLAVIHGDIVGILDRGDLPRPADVALVIEVSHSSIAQDLSAKAELYRTAGISRYLVVDLTTQRFVMHRRSQDTDARGPQSAWSVEISGMDDPLRTDIGSTVTLTVT
jgi:Uma2 family endonuclease